MQGVIPILDAGELFLEVQGQAISFLGEQQKELMGQIVRKSLPFPVFHPLYLGNDVWGDRVRRPDLVLHNLEIGQFLVVFGLDPLFPMFEQFEKSTRVGDSFKRGSQL
jgi:hypothetical protein